MKKFSTFILVLSFFAFSGPVAGAQTLAVKKIMAKYKTDYIPEFKSSLAARTNDPTLADIDVEIDFASFGDNAEELDLAVRELHQAKGAILFLAKDATGKEAIEKGLKKITIRKTLVASKKELNLSGGNLTLGTYSYDLRTMIPTSEIQAYLLKKL